MRNKEKLIIALVLLLFISSSLYVLHVLIGQDGAGLRDREPDPTPPTLPAEERQAEVKILAQPKIAPLHSDSSDYIITDILMLAEEEGMGFCEGLDDEHLRQVCTERHLRTEADRLGDPSICDLCTYPGFIRECKLQAATVAVATEYYRLYLETGDDGVVPANIGMCDQLQFDDDKKICMNPKGAIERNRYELMYRLVSG